MANRKVLINRHTTGNTAPTASEMYLGEIAIAHKTGEEIIWTKNNAEVMVPFISCAQTISIIDSKISGATVSYDVKSGDGEAFINVATGKTGSAVTFTVTSDDVMSEDAFEAYSAATKVRIDENLSAITDLTEIVSALTDIVTTAITGDGIIEVDPTTSGAGSYALSHKTGLTTNGFNKLSTDGYGHVTASTAVETADIQALGFKTSAETGEELAELSASVVANETHISELSAGTIHDIEALSASVVTNKTNIEALSAGTIQLSADTKAAIDALSAGTVSDFSSAFTAINALSADTDAAIKALDSETAVTAGKYLTGIAIADGKISGITEADLPELSVESAGTGNVVSQITVDDHKISYSTVSVATSEDIQALSASVIAFSAETVDEFSSAFTAINNLSADTDAAIAQLSAGTIQLSADTKSAIAALSAGTIQLSADTKAAIDALSAGTLHDIEVLSGAVKANETNITTVSGDVIELSAATVAIETGLDNLSAVTLTGVSLNNTPLTVTDHVISVPVTVSGSGIANATDSGSVADAKAVKEYVENVLSSSVDYKGATDSEPSNPVKGDLWIASSAFTVDGKNVEVGDFIIYNGSSWDVIEKNLDGAITGTLTQDTVVLGDSVNSVKSLANGTAGQVLTMDNGAPAWADLPELASATTGTGNVVTDIAVSDHTITFTKGLEAASKADLEAVSGIVDTFSAATVAEFNSAFTAINNLSADTEAAIDAAIKSLDSVGSASTTGHYLTSVTITDGVITAVGEEAVPAATPVTTVAGTTGDTASAVLTGITTGGTDGHQLTLNATNKIFSAETSDSALTSVSAQTSVSATVATDAVHASAATKVDSALTLTDADGTNSVEFDGSAAKSVTFGTATSISGENSMTMDANGVVDVNIIDCGTY